MALDSVIGNVLIRVITEGIANAQAGLRETAKEVERTEAAGKGAAGALGGVGGAADDAAGSVTALSAALRGFAVNAAVIGSIAVAFGLITKELYDLGSEWDKVSDNIMVRTGRMGDELKKFTDVVNEVYGQTDSKLKPLADTFVTLSKATGAPAEALKPLAKQITDLASMLEVEAAKIAAGYSKVIVQWKVPLEQSTDVLDKIFQVTQKYNTTFDSIVGGLARYGQTLRNLGLDIGSSAELLGKLEQAGIPPTRVINSLREALSKLSTREVEQLVDYWNNKVKKIEVPVAPEEAKRQLNALVTTVQNAKTETEALAAAKKVLGDRMATEFVSAVRGAGVSLQGVNVDLNATRGLIENTKNATKDFIDIWGEQINRVLAEFKGPAEIVYNAIQGIGIALVTTAADGIVGFSQTLRSFAHEMSEEGGADKNPFVGLHRTITNKFKDIFDIFDDFGEYLDQTFVPSMEKAAKASADRFYDHFIQPTIDDFELVGTSLTEMVRDFEQMYHDSVDWARKTYEGVRDWLVDKWTNVTKPVEDATQKVAQFFKDLYDKVVGNSYVPDMMDEIERQFSVGNLEQIMLMPSEIVTVKVGQKFADMSASIIDDHIKPMVEAVELETSRLPDLVVPNVENMRVSTKRVFGDAVRDAGDFIRDLTGVLNLAGIKSSWLQAISDMIGALGLLNRLISGGVKAFDTIDSIIDVLSGGKTLAEAFGPDSLLTRASEYLGITPKSVPTTGGGSGVSLNAPPIEVPTGSAPPTTIGEYEVGSSFTAPSTPSFNSPELQNLSTTSPGLANQIEGFWGEGSPDISGFTQAGYWGEGSPDISAFTGGTSPDFLSLIDSVTSMEGLRDVLGNIKPGDALAMLAGFIGGQIGGTGGKILSGAAAAYGIAKGLGAFGTFNPGFLVALPSIFESFGIGVDKKTVPYTSVGIVPTGMSPGALMDLQDKGWGWLDQGDPFSTWGTMGGNTAFENIEEGTLGPIELFGRQMRKYFGGIANDTMKALGVTDINSDTFQFRVDWTTEMPERESFFAPGFRIWYGNQIIEEGIQDQAKAAARLIELMVGVGVREGLFSANAAPPGPEIRGFATGGHSIITSPTLVRLGEQGPEEVYVSPIAGRATQRGGVTVVMNGPVLMDDLTVSRFARQIGSALEKQRMRLGYG